jgi:integrase
MKWSQTNSIATFERFFNENLTLDVMISKINEMRAKLPPPMAAIIKFNCLTGLRPAEAVESVRLLRIDKSDLPYYNSKTQALEHFRFPDIFLRNTKKAYLSYVTREQLSGVENLGPKTPTWNAIRLATRRRSLKMDKNGYAFLPENICFSLVSLWYSVGSYRFSARPCQYVRIL